MFDKILIANRGEIACRVASTARRMGIRTVAVYSDADANALHVAACDEAFRLGPAPARDSYLRGDTIIAIARKSGAQAIHPGYGFLSENEAFARQCAEAGLVFIGPPPAAIAAMGSKSESKRLMGKAGVPLVPGYHGEGQDAALLRREADQIRYPVLIKASAGGGGKGMRVVEKSGDFAAALASCQREAKASFGDDRVLIEKYLTKPRHIEIQVFADTLGNCVYLFERDCSVQRRHPEGAGRGARAGHDAGTPARDGRSGGRSGEGRRLCRRGDRGVHCGHRGQGGRLVLFHGNEHPVAGGASGDRDDHPPRSGRVAVAGCLRGTAAPDAGAARYQGARDRGPYLRRRSDENFLPSVGDIVHLAAPPAISFAFNANVDHASDPAPVRIDSGVRQGDAISQYYDPMIAKLIVWGEDRPAALRRMRAALAGYRVAGVATNIEFLHRLIGHRAFATADLDTGLIARNQDALLPANAVSDDTLAIAALAEVKGIEAGARERARASRDPHSPWNHIGSWWLNQTNAMTLSFQHDGVQHAVRVVAVDAGYEVTIGKHRIAARVEEKDQDLLVSLDGRRMRARVISNGGERVVFCDGTATRLTRIDPWRPPVSDDAGVGHLVAPMSGTIIAVNVKAGDRVAKGAALLILEAMKMEHAISAPGDGVVEQVFFPRGRSGERGRRAGVAGEAGSVRRGLSSMGRAGRRRLSSRMAQCLRMAACRFPPP